MKKLMMLVLSGVSAIVLSGCGGGSSVSGIDEVNIYDLNQGVLVTANVVNATDQPKIEIEFCGQSYSIVDYNLLQETDAGSFSTSDFYINFVSDVYQPYDLDTLNISDDFLVVGETYSTSDGEDWRITSIELIDCQY